jgi:hypothetical protein
MRAMILKTSIKGGTIITPDGERYQFQWRDAIDFGPSDSGHGTKICFSPGETRGDTQYALSLRLDK